MTPDDDHRDCPLCRALAELAASALRSRTEADARAVVEALRRDA